MKFSLGVVFAASLFTGIFNSTPGEAAGYPLCRPEVARYAEFIWLQRTGQLGPKYQCGTVVEVVGLGTTSAKQPSCGVGYLDDQKAFDRFKQAVGAAMTAANLPVTTPEIMAAVITAAISTAIWDTYVVPNRDEIDRLVGIGGGARAGCQLVCAAIPPGSQPRIVQGFISDNVESALIPQPVGLWNYPPGEVHMDGGPTDMRHVLSDGTIVHCQEARNWRGRSRRNSQLLVIYE